MEMIYQAPPKTRTSKDLSHFINSCEDTLITAARDLATLTQYGIQASFIVNLSKTCESIQQLSHSNVLYKEKLTEVRTMCQDLLIGIGDICHKAKQIEDKPIRRKVYEKFLQKIHLWWEDIASIH